MLTFANNQFQQQKRVQNKINIVQFNQQIEHQRNNTFCPSALSKKHKKAKTVSINPSPISNTDDSYLTSTPNVLQSPAAITHLKIDLPDTPDSYELNENYVESLYKNTVDSIRNLKRDYLVEAAQSNRSGTRGSIELKYQQPGPISMEIPIFNSFGRPSPKNLKKDETLRQSFLNSAGSTFELEKFGSPPPLPTISAQTKNLHFLKRNQRLIYRNTQNLTARNLVFKNGPLSTNENAVVGPPQTATPSNKNARK